MQQPPPAADRGVDMAPTNSETIRRCFKVTRRLSPRVPFRRLRPAVAEVIQYGIAVAANASGVLLHELGIGSQRVQLVLSATDEELNAFMESLDSVVSEGAEHHGKFWRRGVPYTSVPLRDDDAVMDAIVDIVVEARRQGRPLDYHAPG
ncbi:MAG: hypothetical protein AAF721_12120 [Myxococcota bacterium]